MNNKYFAKLEVEELISDLGKKTREYYEFLTESGIHKLNRRAYIAFYGGDLNNENELFQSSILSKDGKAGQITKVKVNNYRNLVKHAVALATANKPALTTVAANTDYKSQAQTILANALLDYYFNVNDIGDLVRQATELSCITGEGWINCPWEPSKGELYDTNENGDAIYSGDLDASVHDLTDVIRDVKRKDTDHKWYILKREANKFDLAETYPSKYEEIVNISSKCEYEDNESFRLQITSGSNEGESDLITYFTFYHEKTQAMPNGRITIYANDVVMFDGDLPFQSVPLVSVMPDRLHKSCFGYSPFNDLISLQQAHDNLMSTVLSNNLTFGTQHLWMQEGMAMNVESLSGGLTLLQSPQPPQPLQLTQSSPETYQLINQINGQMETLSGISSTVRGNPEANLKSGAALALVVAQSVQFGSVLEASYSKMVEKVGEMIIKHIQDFADTPRMATIVGTAKQPLLKEFTKDDIADIRRVQVQQANAMSKTISGRLELATNVMQMPPEQARQYMQIVNTGQLPDEMQTTPPLLVIKQENERLSKGEQVQALVTELHAEHIRIHNQILNSPEAKEDPILVETTLAHIQQHIDLWRSADPAILMITGQQPPPPPNMPMGMPQGQQPMPQSAAPDEMQMEPLPVEGPEEAGMPSLPQVPQGTDEGSQAAYEQMIAGTQQV